MNRIHMIVVAVALACPASSDGSLQFNDPSNPTAPTGITGLDLRPTGFGIYDVVFMSNQRETLDGWATILTYESDRFAADVFPSVANSEPLIRQLQTAIKDALNAESARYVSGLVRNTSDYVFHTGGTNIEQQLLLPFSADGPSAITGTSLYLDRKLPGWSSDVLTDFTWPNNYGTSQSYFVVASTSSTAVIPEVPSGIAWLMLSSIGVLSLRRWSLIRLL